MLDSNRLVVLVDGSSYLFRAFYALPPLTTQKGHPTGAMHGVIKMLMRLYDDYQPNYFAVVFDAAGKTFRHQIYPDYKANRPPMPEDLAVQIQPLHQLITALGFPLIMESGVEADDVIGTLARQALAEDYQVIISSGDKDMTQLLTHADITLLDTMKNETITASDVAKRFKIEQLTAAQVIDFLALVGDKSDNIPGVEKVGAKTAEKWLATYGSLDAIIENADKIRGKVGDNLRAGLAQLKCSQQLATINQTLDLPYRIADLARGAENPHKLAALCAQYELNDIQNRYLKTTAVAAPKAPEKLHYHLIQTIAECNALCEKLAQKSAFVFDVETDSLNYMQAHWVGISFAVEAGEAWYLPLVHQNGINLPFAETLAALKNLFENASIRKIGQHLKFDRHILARYGISLNGVIDDTMLMSYCYNSTATRHNMDDLADFYLNKQTIRFEDIAGSGAKQRRFDEIDLETAMQYACEDADITLQLYQFFQQKLASEPTLQALYENVERPLAEILWAMEHQGVKIAGDKLAAQSQELAAQLKTLEKQAHQLAGGVFNLDSPKQLQEILFERLALPVIHKTPTGQASTNEEVLQKLAEMQQSALPEIILNYRALGKLKSTYTDKLPELIDPDSKRVHTSYHQAVTSTGRLSSSDPNLQNIPIRSDEGRRIRQAFIAEEGYSILAADYSQIELRIMAHLSQDERLQRAFQMQQDIHTATAAELFSVAPEAVDRNQRRDAKAINFGLIYGMSAFGLARQLNISRTQAAEYIDKYFHRYPQVRAYMDSARQTAQQQGYVSTLLGRRLYIPDIHNKNMQRRRAAERLAINAPMQGSAADIIKLAMVQFWQTYGAQKECRLLMQVHDELVFEVATAALDIWQPRITHIMEHALPLNVPLIVDCGISKDWDGAHQ